MQLINNSILTKKSNLEHLAVIKKMPVHFGCVESENSNNDIFLDQEFVICKDTGIVQIKEFPNDELLYMTQHNDAIGQVWEGLFLKILDQVLEVCHNRKNISILEVGAGSCRLAKMILSNDNQCIDKYVVFEPNVSDYNIEIDDKRLEINERYFDNNHEEKYDLVISSHVLEHITNQDQFLKSMYSCMKKNGNQIIVIPNLKKTFEKKYTNAINFEHPFFITEEYVDVMIENAFLKVIEKIEYCDHSLIYKLEKSKLRKKKKYYPNLYNKNKALVFDFIEFHRDFINKCNKKIKNFDGDVYLFGGHIFSQYLIGFGLKTEKIRCILDNSNLKIGKRLYGTNLIVSSPKIIENNKSCIVILKAASYQKEIKEQLFNLNKNVIILE